MHALEHKKCAANAFSLDEEMDLLEFARAQESGKAAKLAPVPALQKAPPAKVDLSEHLHYIRMQTGGGCWSYALLAVWDIMNEMACPYSPNLSMNLPLWVHRMEDLWRNADGFHEDSAHQPLPPGLFLPDGRFIKEDKKRGKGSRVTEEFHVIFGNTTEGTDLTHHQWTGGWPFEAANEASNYRLASKLIPIAPVSSSAFINLLAGGHPIRAKIPGHFVAIVGYDAAKQVFKYVNSSGDKWGDGGFAHYTFSQIDNKNPVTEAHYIKIIPPKPVPAARIAFKHKINRLNVELWLSVEDSWLPKKKIWPHLQPMRLSDSYVEWDENSRNLRYTVRLPSELIWPPSPGSRVVLDLYDSGAYGDLGGTLEEFTAAFGGEIVPCTQLSSGPVSFKVREHKRFYVP
ncbi:MAG: hypothetical protein PVI86_13760 [Phycisphaerae bacterium]|jgi:hypothetical protein